MSHHYRDDFNGRYLVTEMHHRGSQAGVLLAGLKTPFSAAERGTRYANSFSAIAAATQFRAERLTPKPRIAGTMNATIDAEGSGDYAELDEFGQYKVQLPFDLTDKDANKGSTRIRMATPYSGTDHGMHFPLLKSAEVLLSFVDGDPDQPVIMGASPNSENRSVVNNANPAANQIRTKGGNHLHMSDVKGKTGMALHSPKGNTSILLGSSGSDGGDGGEGGGSGLTFLTIGGSEELIVGNDYAATVGMTNYTYIGTENTVNVGLENSVKVGGEFAYAYGSKVEWTNVGGYSLEDGEVIELGETVSKQAGQSLTFAAGYGVTAEAEAAALATLKKGVKAAVLTMTGLNVALGVATSALLLAQSGGASEQGNLGEKGNSWVPIAESAGEAAIVAAGAGAVYLALNLAIKALAHTYEHLATVSTLKMDATGITQTVSLPTANSELRMSALGISLSDVDDAGLEAFLTLQSGAATVCADAVTVKGESVKVGQVEVGDLTSGLSANEAEVVLKNADTAVTLTALTAGIKSPEISIIADAVNGFVVNATETQMSFGGAGVRASLAGLKLSMDGAGVLVFQPGVVSVDAIGVLKLG